MQRPIGERARNAANRGRPDVAARLLRRALNFPTDPDERLRLTISLAFAESELSGLEAGLAVLDGVDPRVGFPVRPRRAGVSAYQAPPTPRPSIRPSTVGLWHGQRGLMLLRAGNITEARTHLDAAADALPATDPERVKVLLNRGVASLRLPDIHSAAIDFDLALTGARNAGMQLEEAMAVGNLGYLAFVRGDLPEALRQTAAAQRILAPQSAWLAGVAARGRADVLLASGLITEAERTYRHSVTRFTQHGHRIERGQAELGLAEIARIRGQMGQARAWARKARRHFDTRGATGWGLLADLELTWVETLTRPTRGAELAAGLEPRLLSHGLREDAQLARLLWISSLTRAGRVAEARALRTGNVLRGSRTRIATRMLAYEVRTQLAVADGDHRMAQATRRRGLADLNDYQSRMGSVDLLTAATRIGGALARDGLAQAVRDGRPAQVFAWSEQVRATSARIATIRPPLDERTSTLLAQLRFVTASQRAEQLATGQADPQWRQHVRQLQAEVRAHTWTSPGAATVAKPVGLGELRRELGSDTMLLSLMTVGPTLHLLAVTSRAVRQVPIADVAPTRELVLRLRADLDQAARSNLPATLRSRVLASMRSGLGRIDAALSTAIGLIDPGGRVVLVPTGHSALVPWNLLHRFAGRDLCVVPSATWWVNARRRGPLEVTGRELHVAGPDVLRAGPEVHACAEGASAATVLVGRQASVQNTLTAMESARVVHVAAHGRHEPDNPLFSALLLADGWLYGHDLDAIAQLPEHVVLSACETGMASIRPGDEALGMTAALLHGGTRSVLASVSRVNDEVAEQVACTHHAGLRAGLAPGQAHADALAGLGDDEFSPTVCFGLGW